MKKEEVKILIIQQKKLTILLISLHINKINNSFNVIQK